MRRSDDPIEVLLDAHAKYPLPPNPYDQVLLQVQAEVERTREIGKRDIGALMLWKRLNLASKWTQQLNDLSDAEVRKITHAAIEIARDTDKYKFIPDAANAAREHLRHEGLPGCKNGLAVSSTILTAGAPQRMAVFDRRARAGLRRLGMNDPGEHYGLYMASIVSLCKDVNVYMASDKKYAGVEPWLPRDVDMGLWILGK